jgi:hypothetical protein
VRIGVSVTKVRRPGGTGPVTVTLEDGGEMQADEVLFATGREPNTDDIGLEPVGLKPGSWLEVDDTCMVRAVEDGWLYTLGDINRHALLTHQGKYQARIAGAAIAARAAGQPVDPAPWGPHAITADYHTVPQVFFHDPLAGAVRLTADQAERAGHRIRVVNTTSAPPSSVRTCTPTATPAAPAWSSTRTTAACSASPSSAPASRNCRTRPPSLSPAMSPSAGSGTPSPASPPSARSGSASSRPTAAEPQANPLGVS